MLNTGASVSSVSNNTKKGGEVKSNQTNTRERDWFANLGPTNQYKLYSHSRVYHLLAFVQFAFTTKLYEILCNPMLSITIP